MPQHANQNNTGPVLRQLGQVHQSRHKLSITSLCFSLTPFNRPSSTRGPSLVRHTPRDAPSWLPSLAGHDQVEDLAWHKNNLLDFFALYEQNNAMDCCQ